jgi:hypothetical protein
MMILIATSFRIGVLLAINFRVFVLLPMIILSAAVILVVGVFHPIIEISVGIISYAISLQFGYLVRSSAHFSSLSTPRQCGMLRAEPKLEPRSCPPPFRC